MSKHKYTSDIILGQKYRDEQTGIVGTATAIYFFQYGCERTTLELVVAGKIEDFTFDSPRLTHVETGKRAESTRTGGPAKEKDVHHAGPNPR